MKKNVKIGFFPQTKCDQYWPPMGGTENYGLIQVSNVHEDVQATHTIRTLKIWNTR